MPRLPSQLTYNHLNGSEIVDILTDWVRQLLQSQPLMQTHLTLPMAKLTLTIDVAVDMYVGGTVPVASPPERLDISGTVSLTNSVAETASSPEMRHTERTKERLQTVVNAAPLPGGVPPDQVREQHSLPVPRPGYGPRETGSHLFLSDVVESTASREPPPPSPLDATGGRRGEVADGYVFSREAVTTAPARQSIPVDHGAIKIDTSGDSSGIQHAGITVSAGTHVSSRKTLGDQGGVAYESVNGVYDAGPAGLMRPGRQGGGLGTDGRSRISFGNSHRG